MEKRVVFLALCASLCVGSIQAADVNNKYYKQYKAEFVDAVNKVYDLLKEKVKTLDSGQWQQLQQNVLSDNVWTSLQNNLMNYAKRGSTGAASTMSTLAGKIYEEIKDDFKAIKGAAATTRQDIADRDNNA